MGKTKESKVVKKTKVTSENLKRTTVGPKVAVSPRIITTRSKRPIATEIADKQKDDRHPKKQQKVDPPSTQMNLMGEITNQAAHSRQLTDQSATPENPNSVNNNATITQPIVGSAKKLD